MAGGIMENTWRGVAICEVEALPVLDEYAAFKACADADWVRSLYAIHGSKPITDRAAFAAALAQMEP